MQVGAGRRGNLLVHRATCNKVKFQKYSSSHFQAHVCKCNGPHIPLLQFFMLQGQLQARPRQYKSLLSRNYRGAREY
jgi:hypothetical protein